MIDALRGVALAGILLLHHIEHFAFYKKPMLELPWLIPIDKWVWQHMFLFFSGKAFALFSVLFGFSYWIIYQNAKQKGEAYLLRHLWRMLLLAGFGFIHFFAYKGDILIMYAVLGLPLIFTRWMSNRVLLLCAIVLLINPLNIYTALSYISTGELSLVRPEILKIDRKSLYLALNEIVINGSFTDVVKANFQQAFKATLSWNWDVGRITLIPSLFLFGCYLAKTSALTGKPLSYWFKVLGCSLVLWLLLDLLKDVTAAQIAEKSVKRFFRAMLDGHIKLSMMVAVVSLLIIAWRNLEGKIFYRYLCNFGRMGLTNYLLMSFLGTFLYYGWGLGLWRYFGSTLSLALGILALAVQMAFSNWWMARHPHGPLETIWRKLTWIKVGTGQPKLSTAKP